MVVVIGASKLGNLKLIGLLGTMYYLLSRQLSMDAIQVLFLLLLRVGSKVTRLYLPRHLPKSLHGHGGD